MLIKYNNFLIRIKKAKSYTAIYCANKYPIINLLYLRNLKSSRQIILIKNTTNDPHIFLFFIGYKTDFFNFPKINCLFNNITKETKEFPISNSFGKMFNNLFEIDANQI